MRALPFAMSLGAMCLAACSEEPPRTSELTLAEQVPALESPRAHITISAYDHQETLRRLYRALDRRDLTVFAVIDHAAGAAQAELELPPSTVVVFGSPALGTPLMLAEPRMALELPLKAAVYEETDGTVRLAVTSMPSLLRAYEGLEVERTRINRIRDNLIALAEEVTGTNE